MGSSHTFLDGDAPRSRFRRGAVGVIVAMIASLISLAAAADAQQLTIAEIVGASPELSTFAAAVTVATEASGEASLKAVSDPSSDLTVFAPTNDAFAVLGPALDGVFADPGGALTEVLLNHIVGESLPGSELLSAGAVTTVLGEEVQISTAGGRITIGAANVEIAAVSAVNGLVYVIDAVVLTDALPPAPDAPTLPTIADVAVGTPELSTLWDAMTVASDTGGTDFVGIAADANANVTLFAPTNDAFAALGPAFIDLVADPDGALNDTLLNHLLGSSETGADLAAAGSATTLLGLDLIIESRGTGLFINDAQVQFGDIETANGLVYVIDAVLVPDPEALRPSPTPSPTPAPLDGLPTIAEFVAATPELSVFLSALTIATDAGAVDLLGAAENRGRGLTVFAPTDAAFDALGPDLDDLLADPGGALTDTLLNHLLAEPASSADLVDAGSVTTLSGQDVPIDARNGDVFINDSLIVGLDVQTANGIVHIIDAVLLPVPPVPESPVNDGAVVYVVNELSGRYLDADPADQGFNVDTSTEPFEDDEWQLEQLNNGNYRIRSVLYDLYLDADSESSAYNVDLGPTRNFGTEWEITAQPNGTYLLRNVDFDRWLDGDDDNTDTSVAPRGDDEWQIVLVP